MKATKKHPNGYWTKDRILEEATKYNNLFEFTKKANGAYCAAIKLGILEEVRKILPFHFQANGYWTYDRCLEESKKYKTKIEFHDGSGGAYSASVKNGWINDFNLVSTRDPNYGKSYTIEELNNLSSKCFNKTEFKEKYHHAYRFAKKMSLLDTLTYIGTLLSSKSYKQETTKKIINPKYSRKGTKIYKRKYSYEKLYEIAQKYTTLKEFSQKENSAYTTACNRGWLKDYTWLEKERAYYDEKKCYEIAKDCKTITELINKSSGAYTFALKHNLLETYDWFEKVNSTLEREIEDLLLVNDISYEKQKKFSWLRYKEPQSLDFYLPDYHIAIECQGEQHFREVKYFRPEKRTLVSVLDSNKKLLCEQHNIKMLYFSNLGIEYPYEVYESKDEILEAIMSRKKS